MVRKVYGGKALTTDEEIVDKILKLPLTYQKRLTDILQTLRTYGDEKETIERKLIEIMKTGKFCKDDYDLLVKTGIIIPVEESYKEKLKESQPETRTKDMIKHERKFQKDRLYEFFNEMVNPMGEKYTGDFMKKTL